MQTSRKSKMTITWLLFGFGTSMLGACATALPPTVRAVECPARPVPPPELMQPPKHHDYLNEWSEFLIQPDPLSSVKPN
jgi:hypothetical protein